MHQQNISNVLLSCHPSLQKPTGLYVFLKVSMCPNFHFVYAQTVSKPANYLPCSCLCLPVTVWKSPGCLFGFILKCSCSCHNLVFKKVGGKIMLQHYSDGRALHTMLKSSSGTCYMRFKLVSLSRKSPHNTHGTYKSFQNLLEMEAVESFIKWKTKACLQYKNEKDHWL